MRMGNDEIERAMGAWLLIVFICVSVPAIIWWLT